MPSRRQWVEALPSGKIPPDVLVLLGDQLDDEGENYTANRPVEVSSRYIGGGALGQTSDAQSITDGSSRTIWMTKNEPFPQSCTIDLGRDRQVGCVIIRQHAPFAMTEFSVEVCPEDGEFAEADRKKNVTEATQVVAFEARPARYIRVNSLASRNPTYPTAMVQIEVRRHAEVHESPARQYEVERAVRAMGVLGGEGGCQ